MCKCIDVCVLVAVDTYSLSGLELFWITVVIL